MLRAILLLSLTPALFAQADEIRAMLKTSEGAWNRGDLAAFASDQLEFDDTSRWVDENVPQIRVPSVIIGGENDHLIGIDHMRRLAETLPNTKLITVDGSHMIPYTHPDVIAEQVKSASRG